MLASAIWQNELCRNIPVPVVVSPLPSTSSSYLVVPLSNVLTTSKARALYPSQTTPPPTASGCNSYFPWTAPSLSVCVDYYCQGAFDTTVYLASSDTCSCMTSNDCYAAWTTTTGGTKYLTPECLGANVNQLVSGGCGLGSTVSPITYPGTDQTPATNCYSGLPCGSSTNCYIARCRASSTCNSARCTCTSDADCVDSMYMSLSTPRCGTLSSGTRACIAAGPSSTPTPTPTATQTNSPTATLSIGASPSISASSSVTPTVSKTPNPVSSVKPAVVVLSSGAVAAIIIFVISLVAVTIRVYTHYRWRVLEGTKFSSPNVIVVNPTAFGGSGDGGIPIMNVQMQPMNGGYNGAVFMPNNNVGVPPYGGGNGAYTNSYPPAPMTMQAPMPLQAPMPVQYPMPMQYPNPGRSV